MPDTPRTCVCLHVSSYLIKFLLPLFLIMSSFYCICPSAFALSFILKEILFALSFFTDCYDSLICVGALLPKLINEQCFEPLITITKQGMSQHFLLKISLVPKKLCTTRKPYVQEKPLFPSGEQVAGSSRCRSRGTRGPGSPLTLGFEAPKLSIFLPYLIFP